LARRAFEAFVRGREQAGQARVMSVGFSVVAGVERGVERGSFSCVKWTGRRCFKDSSCGAVEAEPGQRDVGFLVFEGDDVGLVLVVVCEEGIQKDRLDFARAAWGSVVLDRVVRVGW